MTHTRLRITAFLTSTALVVLTFFYFQARLQKIAQPSANASATKASVDRFTTPRSQVETQKKNLRLHPMFALDAWTLLAQGELEDRIITNPADEVIEYLRQSNALDGIHDVPERTDAPLGFVDDLKRAMHSLPPFALSVLKKKSIGIVLVQNLGMTSQSVRFESGNRKMAGGTRAIVFLDAVWLNHSPNLWFSVRENSPYAVGKNFIRATLSSENNTVGNAVDDRWRTIQYVLLEEVGHLLTLDRREVVPLGALPDEVGDIKTHSFSRLAWSIDNGQLKSNFDTTFPLREKLHYYAERESQIPDTEISTVFEQILKTDFVSPYAARSPQDDFAESFASYVHVEIMKRPWTIIRREGEEMGQVLKSCWRETRCSDKRRELARIIQSVSS